MAKYNQKTVETFLQTLAEVKSPFEACKSAGIAYKTYYEWMKEKPEFKAKVDEVNDNVMIKIKWRALNAILAAVDNDWRAASFLLERRFPEEYGKRDNVQLDITSKKITFQIGLNQSEENPNISISPVDDQKLIDNE